MLLDGVALTCDNSAGLFSLGLEESSLNHILDSFKWWRGLKDSLVLNERGVNLGLQNWKQIFFDNDVERLENDGKVS